ncbi:MAG TPA: polyprenyl diphosphate synthase [Candidatus Saccharimonadales bacterium]|nr:polyprenyl diphosphate synthase [Candidatus Saccharimonadales bacterium]
MISHLGLIMDGNRRWAKGRGMFPWLGHRQGAKTVEMVLTYCLEQKISYVSLYTFSLENFKRSETEISYLFALIDESQSRVQEFIKSDVKVRFVGDLAALPEKTRQVCLNIEAVTAHCMTLQCNFLMCYGGQQEILAAATKLMQDKPENLSIDLFKKYLWLGDIPDPEVIIRTGGVHRLSNFLLFQAAYAEIKFLDCLWPDLTQELLHETLMQAVQAKKNFGS